MLWHIASNRSFEDPHGIAQSAVAMGPSALDGKRKVRKSKPVNRRRRSSTGTYDVDDLASMLDEDMRLAEESGRAEALSRDSFAEVKVCAFSIPMVTVCKSATISCA